MAGKFPFPPKKGAKAKSKGPGKLSAFMKGKGKPGFPPEGGNPFAKKGMK